MRLFKHGVCGLSLSRLLVASLVVTPAGNLLSAAPTAAQSQSPLFPAKPTAKKSPPAVTYLFPEQLTLPANKPTAIDLHFRIGEGLHINSHTPSGEGLIPTTLSLPESSGVRLTRADFPAGTNFTFTPQPGSTSQGSKSDQPAEKFSVYTGDFTVHTQLVATAGDHLVEATLHYQACNDSQCLPPRSIPVTIDVISK